MTQRSIRSRSGPEIRPVYRSGTPGEHVQELVHRTGVREVHVRGTRLARAEAAGANERVLLRKPLPTDENVWEETDETRIREFVRLANG